MRNRRRLQSHVVHDKPIELDPGLDLDVQIAEGCGTFQVHRGIGDAPGNGLGGSTSPTFQESSTRAATREKSTARSGGRGLPSSRSIFASSLADTGFSTLSGSTC